MDNARGSGMTAGDPLNYEPAAHRLAQTVVVKIVLTTRSCFAGRPSMLGWIGTPMAPVPA